MQHTLRDNDLLDATDNETTAEYEILFCCGVGVGCLLLALALCLFW